ncbi:hypothetical protein [Fervidobacterium sp. 2310opik-2]|uniref:hypothetical protein n=1 Tax=Fervidobacterium sp. 2310opik-2 TaxID=1755815 RepID=UPI0013E0E36E|nr:hypothetical protein [Fervidobacterium sp. 2310opik-2]KAF2961599.1 hypothetical protein AS161_08610 [Fervidobacterium sp. 2310opik-2]
MIRAIINGEEKVYNSNDFENFGAFLSKMLPSGMVLKSLKINDKDIPISFVEELKGAKIDEDIKIEMEFVNTVEFLKETLNDVLGYINNVKVLLPQVASSLIVGNESGWKAITDLSDGLAAMENLRNSTQQITKLSEEELNLSKNREEIANTLRELLNSLSNRDNIEISDIVENKIPDVLDYYIEYFTKILEALKNVN